jgi:protein-disulfide isomerase
MRSEKKSKRQERREKMRQRERRNRLLTIGIISIVAAFLVFMFVYPQVKSVGEIIAITPETNLPNPDGLSLGDPNAPVTVDVYEDFQCPACQRFTETIQPLIMQHLITPGKIIYNFHHYPFLDGAGARGGGESDQAANASMCANEQGKFWDMNAILFANWNGENLGNLNDRRLQAMAERIGLDMNAFNACFDANKYEDEIQADFDHGNEIGVSGTPSVFVNGVKVGQPGKIPSYQEIAEAVELAINTTE